MASALLLWSTACSPDPKSPPTPRAVDTAALVASQVPDAVLDECHAPLRGRMDRVQATIVTADGKETRAYAAFPDRLRVQDETGQFLARGGEVLRIGGTQAASPANAAERQHVLQLRRLLDAAALGPLHRATGCRRLGAAEFELTQPDGATFRMALRPGTLLPRSLQDREGEIDLVEWQHTSATWLVAVAAVPELGNCRVRFDVGDIQWAPDFFTPPEARPAAPVQQHLTDPGVVVERQSPTPILIEAKALGQVLLPDPGDWRARAAAYAPVHAELQRQDQVIAGFPQLWQQDGARWLAAPFRRRTDGPALVAKEPWRLHEIPAGRWLVVYPPEGDLAARIAAGEGMLQTALRERDLHPRGPILSQPWLHLEEGEPDPQALAAPKVRMAVPVQ